MRSEILFTAVSPCIKQWSVLRNNLLNEYMLYFFLITRYTCFLSCLLSYILNRFFSFCNLEIFLHFKGLYHLPRGAKILIFICVERPAGSPTGWSSLPRLLHSGMGLSPQVCSTRSMSCLAYWQQTQIQEQTLAKLWHWWIKLECQLFELNWEI